MSDFDQACVVPYRQRGGAHEFCLVTSTSRGDWIFPKGNIDPGFTAEAAGLQEAHEEAGLSGHVVGTLTEFTTTKLGRYSLTVVAMLMEVSHAADTWDEDQLRQRRWASADEVRGLVERPELLEAFRAALAHLTGEAQRGAEGSALAELAPGASALVLLEDDARRVEAMREQLATGASGHEVVVFDNAPDTIAWLERHLGQVALLSLDHDLGPNRTRNGDVFDPGSGRDVVDWLESREPCCPVIVHTSNTLAAPGMVLTLRFANWPRFRVAPYGDLDWVAASWLEAVRNALAGDPGDQD